MITYYPELVQGSDEWREIRRGILTASEMHLVVTPKKLEVANNDKVRSHVYELMAQRVTGYVEPSYISDDMLLGWTNEIESRNLYSEKYHPVKEVGFVTNAFSPALKLGCSPDGLVGDDGIIECKSRRQKFQAQTIALNEVPEEYAIQIQTALLVTGRKFCDFISYCGGMPMFVKRVEADEDVHIALLNAATLFEERVVSAMKDYEKNSRGLYPTERKIDEGSEIIL